jgi:hypothetical protein
MKSFEINELYELIREGNEINDRKMITKSFVLDIFDAPEECFSSDLEALKFLLEVRASLKVNVS